MSTIAERLASLSPEKRALLNARLQKAHSTHQQEKITRRPDMGQVPLSYAQQRLWFLDQLDPGSPLYNIPGALCFTGPLSVAALQKSLAFICQRHESLRAHFVETDGEPQQQIDTLPSFDLPVVDLTDLSTTNREEKAQSLAIAEAQRPFNLNQSPLIRATLLKMQPEEHILLLTVHHIAFDGWSTGIFLREMAACYDAFGNGRSPLLPTLPIQYADYAHWQRQWLQGDRLDVQWRYWQQQLDPVPSLLDLPTDHPRPPLQTFSGAHFQFTLPETLSAQIEALAKETHTTLFMTLLTAFQLLLGRYARSDDICVGVPVANRTRSEIEGLIGFFVNTLVMRTDLSGSPSFRGLLQQVREVTLAAYDHQDLPFEMLVEKLQPARDMSHSPLFQVMFELQDVPPSEMRIDNLSVSLLPIETQLAKFDLMLIVQPMPEAISAEFEYNTDLFEPETIQRMAGHLQVLLEAVVANPDQSIATLPLLTKAEQRQILGTWNETAVPYPQDQCLHHLFAQQAEKTPQTTAVVAGNGNLTYQTLNQQANQLAHFLQKQGIKPNTLVGLCVERSVEMIVGIMGILKAGGAYLPLDPAYPLERLNHMLADSNAPILLTQRHLVKEIGFATSLNETSMTIICLDSDWNHIAQEPITNPVTANTATDLAYVIYTSGSTGKPKGSMIPHRGALNLLAGLDHIVYQSLPKAPLRLSLNAPISFDASVQQLVMLLHGHTLYIIPQEIRGDGEALLTYIRQHQINVVDCVPTQLNILIDAGLLENGEWAPAAMLPGGEAIGLDCWRTLAQTDHIAFYNMYGPTECSVDSTICPVHQNPEKPSIGRPIINAHCYVLDRNMQPVPVGIPGELHIGGAGVGSGYLYRPDLTNKKFIPNPFLQFCQKDDLSQNGRQFNAISIKNPAPVLYKTGDLVRYLPNGHIEFLGRIDHQVKIRGFRIELEEIKLALLEHAAVKEAVVITHCVKEAGNDRRLAAYLVLEEDRDFSAPELRQFLKLKLPDYMVPSFFIPLGELPLTPNRKIDRRRLPEPNDLRAGLATSYVAPRTHEEEVLAELWMQVLTIEEVGIYDNFFELGGHSLLATQLVSRIRRRFQVTFTLRELFNAPTIAETAVILSQPNQTTSAIRPPIQPTLPHKKLTLSYAQQRLWFLDQLEPDSPLYNIADSIRITGLLNIPALTQSLNEVIDRHEILRTTITTIEGEPILDILPELRLTIPVIDCQGLCKTDQESEIYQRAQEEAKRPFNLSKAPLIRITLLRLAENDHIALITMHHIISDGWSVGVLIKEITALYHAVVYGSESSLPDLPIQYGDFAHWQHQQLASDNIKTQVAYWKEQLIGSQPFLTLPTDHPRPAIPSYQGKKLFYTLSSDLTQGLKKLSQQEDATLFMTLLAAFQILLMRHSHQENINVGTPIANRNQAEWEDLIGFFVNTLVLRTDLSGNPDFHTLLQQVRQTALTAFAHQDVPFEMVVDAIQPERDLSYNPLFQVMFVLQNATTQPLTLPDLTLTQMPMDTGMAKFDLTLAISETDGQLAGTFEYNTDLFETTTIRRMWQHYETLLQAIVTNPYQSIEALPLLTPMERQQLLVEWNQTTAVYPHNQTIHQIIETQAAHLPQAIAVQFQEQKLTYLELNQKSNQLAHYLRTLNVGPDTLVALSVDRSLDMIIGILGILKAGGAYVPMDPAYPLHRLTYMLNDTKAPILVTQSHLTTKDKRDTATQGSVQTIIHLDEEWPIIARHSQENPVNQTTPDNLAYVIYTSGSTGKPKGTLLTHRGLCNFAHAYVQDLHVGVGNQFLQFASLSFDASVAEIFTCLTAGATLHLTERETLLSGPDLVRLFQNNKISHAIIPPAVLAVLDIPDDGLPHLKTIISVGESCPVSVARKWAIGRSFFNGYGPTEATVGPTLYFVEHMSSDAKAMPIGKPLINIKTYILDKHMEPVPIGVAGELFIGGICLARGYLNLPELTNEKFVPNPFLPEDGTEREARLYKTGDLARYLSDGNIEFLGRRDQQIKIRGFRVELEEIEAVLEIHDQVQKTAVLLKAGSSGQTHLVAYCVLASQEPLDSQTLKHFVGSRVPDYMIPTSFLFLDTMPLTNNGKIDREALLLLEDEWTEPQDQYVAPRTDNETIMVRIWEALLGVENIGIHDNFFERGGDSILTIQLVARARQAGLILSPKQLFQHPTIAELAQTAVTNTIIQAEQGEVTGLLPLTPIQHWFFEQNLAEAHHWNQSIILETRESVDPELLKTAVRHIIIHHDALRIYFQKEGNSWVQINDSVSENVPFSCIDLSHLSEDEQTAVLKTEITKLQRSLGLSKESQRLHCAIIKRNPQPDLIFIVIHHLIVDTVSWRILLEDLHTAYQQLANSKLAPDQQVQLPSKTTSFQQWSEQLQTYAQSTTLHTELDIWMTQINKHPATPLPRDFQAAPNANTEASAETIQVTLSKIDTESLLRDVPAAYGTTINHALLAVLGQTVAQWTNQPSLLIDIEGHGREDIFEQLDISRTVGWFTTLYPAYLNVGSNQQLDKALKAIKEQINQIPQNGIGFGLLRYLNPTTAQQLQSHPQAEISFNYLGQLRQTSTSLEEATFWPSQQSFGSVRSPQGKRRHLIAINSSISKEQLQVDWTYSTQIHRSDTIEMLAASYINNLQDLIAHCRSPESVGYTPSDFPDADLNEDELNALLNAVGELE